MTTKLFRFVIPIFLVVSIAIFLAPLLWAAPQDTVVGDGTPASCDNNALGAALTADGTVTFNCGPDPHTILADTYVINHAITVDGGDLITLDGENLRQIFIVQAGASLTLNHIILTQGNWFGNGGAIANYGTLMLNESTVRDSRAEGEGAVGGGIFNQDGTVMLNNSQLLNNYAVYAGGGLENSLGTVTLYNTTVRGNEAASYAGIDSTGTTTVQNSTIAENNATTGYGGGVGVNDGAFTLQDSTVANNVAQQSVGGGLAAIGGVTLIERSQLHDNIGAWGGGGLYVNPNHDADVTVRDSTITGNKSTAQDPPVSNPNTFGGGVYGSRNVTLERVTISDNTSAGGGGLFYYQDTGVLVVRDSTISGNIATGVAGGLWLDGGSHTLTNVTVSGNTSQGAYGGGILNDGATTLESVTLYGNSALEGDNLVNRASLTLHNTIVAAPAGVGVNCGGGANSVAITSAGYNLVSDESCAIATAGDQQGIDPLLGPLADNGGPTQTHLPQPGSPAVNAVLGDCPATDQRGLARPAGAACDIGAVEVEPDAPTPTVTPTATPTNPPPSPTPTNTPTSAPLNYAITTLEVTQGIQDLQNSVPLVRGKAAWVRAHVRRASGDSSPLVSAQLWRIVNGQYSGNPIYPSNPGGKLAPATFPSRSQLNDSFYFPIPADWLNAANLQVEVEVNPQLLNSCNNPLICVFRWWRETPETTYNDNVLRSPVLSLQNVPTMRLWLYNVVYSKKVGNTTTWYQANNTQLFEIEDWLRRAYPIAGLFSQRSTTTIDESGIYRWVKDDKGNDVYQLQAGLVNQRLNLVRNIEQAYNPNFIRQARYYGVVTDASGDFMRGLGGGFIASGPTGNASTSSWGWWDKDSASYGDWYAGHEIGHTWNRGHPVAGGFVNKDDKGCGHSRDDANYPYPNAVIGGNYKFIKIGVGGLGNQWLILPPDRYYGFDIFLRGQVVYDPDWADMMSYCDKQWISDYTYNAIRAQMQSEGLVQAAQVMGPAGEYALIQGEFSDDLAAATLGAILQIPSPAGQPLPEPGDFAIHLRGANDTLLASYPFTPTVYEDAEDNHAYYINVAVPYPAGVQKIEVRKGDVLLTTRTVSANPPGVQVTSPNGGETVDEAGLTVTWSMSDADGDPMSASVLFSPDNGQSWQTLAVNLTDTQVVLAFASLSGTTQGRIRVLVTDGVNTAQDESDGAFTVNGHMPEAAILAPAVNATFVVSQTVLLHGSGYDVEDGGLPTTAFVWQSDRDGVLGTGSEVAVNTLSPGTHVITLQVTDAANNVTTASRTIIVGEDLTSAPSTLAVAPQTILLNAVVGSTAQPTATLALRDSNAGTGLTAPLTWNATADVAWLSLAQTNGNTPSDIRLSATTVNLPMGTYTATVTVTASNGNVQSVPVQLNVLPTNVVPDVQEAVYLPLITR